MVSFVRKRLQVFVSSTFCDLIQERQAAVEAILTAGHIPAGMELFTAGDESQMEVIKQWIDESDVYLMILAGRYGSTEPNTGKSYTQLEYEYAVGQAKPLFACARTEDALDERVKKYGRSHIETDNPQRLKEFREIVLSRMVRFWADSKDIKIAIGETLAHFSRRPDLAGWIRAGDVVNTPALADEIARLSKENALLRNQITNSQPGFDVYGLSFDEVKAILKDKGLLDFFLKNPRKLDSDYTPAFNEGEGTEECAELALLGLLSRVQSEYNTATYTVSDKGRIFLNRIEAQRLREKT